MPVYVRVPLFAAFLLAAAPPAIAQIIPGWDTKQFTFERLDADRVLLVNEVEAVGTGPNAGQQLFADRIEWNFTTGEFVASGNVLMVSPTSRLAAERVVFNTKTGRGTFERASGIASLAARGIQDQSMFGMLEPDVYFYGETIEKIGEDKYRITRGGFTTCVQPTPRWDIVSGKATIDLGDYAILRNAVMRVKDVPVFYLPILYYPIQDDGRATGFLLPTYGSSTYRGQSLSNAFFWAINRSQDATFMHDWFTSRGQGGGGEYRYVSGPSGDGFFRAYWLNEKESALPGSTTLLPARRSFELRGRLVQALPARMTARANVDYFSSVETQQLYNTNIYEATRSQRQYAGTVSGSWGRINLTSNYNRSEVFLTQTSSTTTGNAPGVNISVSSAQIGRLPVYFAMTNDAARTIYINRSVDAAGVETIQDLGLRRMDIFPTLRAPLTKWPFLTVNASTGARSSYFSESEDPLDASRTRLEQGFWRRYAEVRADVTGPVFSRVFSPGSAFAERMKHLIEPNFSIQRTTKVVNQERVPTTGSSYDIVVGDTTQMTYGLTNRLMVRPRPKKPVEGEPVLAIAGAPRELLSVAIYQSYYTNPAASKVDRTIQSAYYRDASNFSPIVLNARSAPTDLTTTTVVAEYDASKGLLNAVSAAGTVNYRQVQARGGWSNRLLGTDPVTRTRTNTLDASSTVNLAGGRTGGTYSMNWDITRGQILQQRWTGFYNAQCCGIILEYQEFSFGLGATIPKDRRFNLSFSLAGIGSFSNFFGAFGGGGMGGGRY